MNKTVIIITALLLALPFVFFMLFINRRTQIREVQTNTIQQNEIPFSRLAPQDQKKVDQEFNNLTRLKRGVILSIQGKKVTILNEDPFNIDDQELLEFDVSNINRIVCWNEPEHLSAKTAYFPLEENSFLSLNNEIEYPITNFNFGNQIGSFILLKVTDNKEGAYVAEQAAIIDCQ